jgi:hypothetical protein
MHRTFPYYIQIKWKRLCLTAGVIITAVIYSAMYLLLHALDEYRGLREWLGTLSGAEIAILIAFSVAFTLLTVFTFSFITYNSPEVQGKMEKGEKGAQVETERRRRDVDQYDVN